MICEVVRDQLAEHMLGTVGPQEDLEIRAHLRGCGECRRELDMLEEGLSTFARAAHQAPPPPQLRDRVLAVLDDERADSPAPPARRLKPVLLLQAAAVIALAGALVWGSLATVRATHLSNQAGRYQAFLEALGGRDVRVGTLHARGSQATEGSAILYDSDVGQSWALVLVQAPGMAGQARVVLSSPTGRTIEMHALLFSDEGEASSWLVTPADISGFDRVRVVSADGRVLATGRVDQHET